MGFEVCILPKQSIKGINPSSYQMRIIGVSNIKQAFAAINKIAREKEATDKGED